MESILTTGGEMSRRQFNRALIAGAGAALLPSLKSAAGAQSKPRFRFIMVSDAHVQAPAPGLTERVLTYAGANERFSEFVGAVNADPPDFVIGIGDMIHGEERKRLEPDFQQLREAIKPFRCAYHPVVGNHEVVQREGDPDFERPYVDAFGKGMLNYTFQHGGILFISLNDAGARSVKQEVTHARNQWLKETLEAAPELPKILCCHIPLVPIREEAVLARSFGFGSYMTHDKELGGIVDAHSDTLIAVLTGHLHLTGMVKREGVYHVATSGTASYPHDYALCEVHDDRLHVRIKSLPETLARKETNIHGRPRHAADYTDKEHPTFEQYLRGGETEREFDIALAGKKNPARRR